MDIVKNTHNFNLVDDKNITNNDNIIFVLLIIHYFIVLLLFYKYKFYENQQNDMKNKIELSNKKYLHFHECIDKLIFISNDITKKINTFDTTISKIKKIIKKNHNEILILNKNNNLLNEKTINIEKYFNNEIDLIKKEIKNIIPSKIIVIEEKLNNKIETINNNLEKKETENYVLLNEKINILKEKINNEKNEIKKTNNNIIEEKINSEIEKINIIKEKETENFTLLNEKINILTEKINNENKKSIIMKNSFNDRLDNEIKKLNIIEETLNCENEKIKIIEEKINNEIEKIKETTNFLTTEIEKQIKIIPISNNPCHFIDFNCSVIEFTIIDNKCLCLFENFNYNYDKIFNKSNKTQLNLEDWDLKNINYKLIDISKLTIDNLQSFFSQFKNIKNIYFNFGNECNNDLENQIYETQQILKNIICLFFETTDVLKFNNFEVGLTFNNFNKNERNKIEFINNFSKINNYKSMNIKIVNNLLKPNQSNLCYILHECFDNLKNHCQLNNINFSSNIGL
jgi:hypothetical protein